MKILLIDDMDTYVGRFMSFAKAHKFQVDVIGSLGEFESALDESFKNVNIILLDEHLSDCYGKELFLDSLLPKIEAGLFPKLQMLLGNSSTPRKQDYISEYEGKFPGVKFVNVGKSGMETFLEQNF